MQYAEILPRKRSQEEIKSDYNFTIHRIYTPKNNMNVSLAEQ